MAVLTPYVKFLRGSLRAYTALTFKDPDTFYVVTDDEGKIYLYVGDRLICSGSEAVVHVLNDLEDVEITGLSHRNILVYNAEIEAWVNKTPTEAIGIMSGATATQSGTSGLVPVPQSGDQNKFLRGDGTWAFPAGQGLIESVDPTVFRISDEKELQLKAVPKEYVEGLAEIEEAIDELNERITWHLIEN